MPSCKRLLPLAPMLMLTNCAGTTAPTKPSIPILAPPSTAVQTPISAIDPLCSQVRIVELSRIDSTGTKKQVEANNAVITKVCGH